MATQLTTTNPAQGKALTAEGEHFALLQRKASLFARSPLIPETLRAGGEEQALANCYIGLTMAEAMQEEPLTVLQNITVIKGKAGFSAQFMIARANASGVFKGRIGWRVEGKADAMAATAHATLADTGEEVSFTVDMAMAKAEGWTSNKKYQTMPEVMLRYRSATFLVRFYAPDVMFGFQTREEVEDVAFATGEIVQHQPLSAAMITDQAAQAESVDTPVDTPVTQGPATTDTRSSSERFRDDLLADIASPDADLKAIDTEFVKSRALLDDEHAAEVEAALAAARKRVAS